MKVGLKNVVDILPDLVDYFDFAVNEECFQFTECHVRTVRVHVFCRFLKMSRSFVVPQCLPWNVSRHSMQM